MAKINLNENLLEKATLIKEGLPKGVLARIDYPIMRFDVKNANNRIYGREVAENVLKNEDIQKKLASRTLFGNMEHPADSQVKLHKDETSHIISAFRIDEKNKILYSTIDLLPTEAGKFINVLLEAGCLVGTSTRADGELEEKVDEAGGKYNWVIPKSYLFRALDFTGDPSTPDSVPENIIKAVESHYNSKDINKNLAMALLETVKTDESRRLIEAIKQDKQHESCKCAIGDKKCTTCNHVEEKKEEKKANEEPLLKEEIPVGEQIKVGSAVKVNEQTGIVAHIFKGTKKAIIQYATIKEVVDLSKCKLVTEKKSNDWKAESELTENQRKHLSVFTPRFNKEKSVWEYKVDAQSLSKILEKKVNETVEVDTTRYEFSHGKRPVGTGSWAFYIGSKKEATFIPGILSYGEAKKKAIEIAKEKGISLIAVAEGKIKEDIDSNLVIYWTPASPSDRASFEKLGLKGDKVLIATTVDSEGEEIEFVKVDGKRYRLTNGWTKAIPESVELEVNIDKQVEEFLKANRQEFKTDDEAKESLIKAFKITPEKAEEYVKKMVKGETPMDVEKKVISEAIKPGDRFVYKITGRKGTVKDFKWNYSGQTVIPLQFDDGEEMRVPLGNFALAFDLIEKKVVEAKVGDKVKIVKTELYNDRIGKVEWVGDGKVKVAFVDGKSPAMNLFDLEQIMLIEKKVVESVLPTDEQIATLVGEVTSKFKDPVHATSMVLNGLIQKYKLTLNDIETIMPKIKAAGNLAQILGSEKKVVEAKSTDRWEITYVDSGKTVTMTTAQAQKKFGTAEFAEISQGYAPHIIAVNLDEKKVNETLPGETTGGASINRCDCGAPLPLKVLKSAAGYYYGYFCPKCGPYGRESQYFKTKEQAEKAMTNLDGMRESYINEIIHLSEGLREQEQIFNMIKEMFKLQKTFTKEDIIAALKDYIHEQEVVKAENSNLKENLKIKDEGLGELHQKIKEKDEKIQSYKMSPDQVRKLEKELEEDEKRIEELEAEKEVMEKRNLELTEAHARELVKVYANTRIKVSGLKIPKQFNAILEACGDFEEVDRVITEIQDGIREGIINKANLSEIIVGVEKKVDPKQEKLDKTVANVFKGMGV